MSPFPLIFSKSELIISRNARVLRNDLGEWCAENDIEFDDESMAGVWKGRSKTFLYNWEYKSINPEDNKELAEDEDEYGLLTQEIRTSTDILSLYIKSLRIPLLSLALVYWVQQSGGLDSVTQGFSTVMGGIAALLLIITWLPSMLLSGYQSVDYDNVPDPLVDGRDDGIHYANRKPSTLLEPLMYIKFAIIAVVAIINQPQITLAAAVLLLLLYVILLGWWYADSGKSFINLQTSPAFADLRLSSVPKQYLFTVLNLSVVPALVVGFNFFVGGIADSSSFVDLESFNEYMPSSIPLVDTIVMLLLAAYLIKYFSKIGDETMKISYYKFKSDNPTIAGKLVDAVGIFSASIILYGVFFTGLNLMTTGSLFKSGGFFFGVRSSYSVAMLGMMYFPAGLLYQGWKEWRHTKQVLANSSTEVVDVDGYTREYLLLNSEKLAAHTFTTFKNDYIVISKRLKDVLDSESFAAIVAHEEGHIKHKDHYLSQLLSILSVFLLVGKNSLYSLVDFQQREIKADQYAKETLGKQPLIRAFEKRKEIRKQNQEESYESQGLNFAPHFDEPLDSNYLNIFNLYFGGFALEDSHKGIQERISQLKSD